MRSLLDGITSALRISQQHQQEQMAAVDSSIVSAQHHHLHQSLTLGDAAVRLPESGRHDRDHNVCRFSLESFPDLPFTMLLLTQNIGGMGTRGRTRRGENKNSGDVQQGVKGDTIPTNFAEQQEQEVIVAEFLAELRLLVYEASRREYATHFRKRMADTGDSTLPPADDAAALEAPPLLDVIVVHFQEIGGKRLNREFNALFSGALRMLLPEAGWTSGLLMNDGENEEKFTALGSIVFLSRRMCPISSMLSFCHRTFVCITDDPATYGSSPTFLFHGGKFSGAGASRKGYLLVSMRFGTVVVNYLNIHLHHDTRNTDAAEVSPNPCAVKRQEALLEAMAECLTFISPQDPLFIFGDFSTHLDAFSLLSYLKEIHRIDVDLESKDVRAPDGFWQFFENPQHVEQVKAFDVELRHLIDVVAQQSGVELAEFATRFPPTYLRPLVRDTPQALLTAAVSGIEETMEGKVGSAEGKKAPFLSDIVAVPARGYQRKRIPAWCDRVVWNPAGLEMMTGRRTSSSSYTTLKNGGDSESRCRYVYRSFALSHTDHDCVALFF